MEYFESWGRHQHSHSDSHWIESSDLKLPTLHQRKMLPHGMGRSYGDCCLNDGGVLLRTRRLNGILSFDERTGVLDCESGVTLDEVIRHVLPAGWFLPVSPGTKFVTLGGAVANDVYGKNHPSVGTFGCHVLSFDLLRSDGSLRRCSPEENAEWFRATIGGLGLTGLITRVQLRLKQVHNAYFSVECVKTGDLDELLAEMETAHTKYEYTVGWIDGRAPSGRGLVLKAVHDPEPTRDFRLHSMPRLSIPFDMPVPIITNLNIRMLNLLYRNRQLARVKRSVQHYDKFMYPLDAIMHWNRVVGKRGFYQYQCVVPARAGKEPVKEFIERVTRAKQGTFLFNLRCFGEIASPGLLSFPRPGFGLDLDYYNRGEQTRQLFRTFDGIVRDAQGRLNPAKDACMGPEDFRRSFASWDEYEKYIDPAFSSDMYLRLAPRKV